MISKNDFPISRIQFFDIRKKSTLILDIQISFFVISESWIRGTHDSMKVEPPQNLTMPPQNLTTTQ